MNKYFLPVYHSQLKPWIKWWILKRLSGGQSSLKAITLSSGTLTKVDKSKALSIKEYYGNTVQNGTPTPESPVEIQTISGNNEVVVCGKNLFDKDNVTSGQAINVNTGASVTDSNYMTTNYIPVNNGNYIINSAKVGGTNNYGVTYYDSNKNFINGYSWNTLGYTSSGTYSNFWLIINDSNIKYIKIAFRLGANPTNPDTLQIEKGTTTTTYEPYVGNSYRVDFGGKNKLQPISESQTVNGITFTLNEDKSITLNGTATANALVTIYGSWSGTTIYQALDKNSYYTISGSPSNDIQIYIRTTNGSTITGHNPYSSPTFTGQTGIVNYFIQVINGTVCDNITIYPQLEKGTVATEYSPYVSNPIELCKIGNYKDTLFHAVTGNPTYDSLDSTTKESLTYGSWYIEKNIGKVVLNGSESWSINKSGTANWYYYANISSININTDSTSSNTLCDHYTWGSVGVSNTNTGYYIVKNNGQVRIRYGTEDTVANYKTWLAENNPIVYYIRTTPTTETITNTNLISQLNALYEFYVESSTVTISNNSEIPLEVLLEYYGR